MTNVLVTGRVGTDPELRYTPSGAPVLNFQLAEDRRRSGTAGAVPGTSTGTARTAGSGCHGSASAAGEHMAHRSGWRFRPAGRPVGGCRWRE